MNEQEFLQRLAELRRAGWHAFVDKEGAVRLQGDTAALRDPITAVCESIEHEQFALRYSEVAASQLGMDIELARRIRDAANGFPSAAGMRKKLATVLRIGTC